MSSDECRIPNISICTVMSLTLELWIFSNMSFEGIHVLSNTFNILFFFPRIVDFIIMYYKVINHTKANFSKPFSHISCILNFSSCVFCFLLIIFAFPDSKRACFTLDVIKDIILGKCVRNYVYFEEVHWQRKITRTSLWKMH